MLFPAHRAFPAVRFFVKENCHEIRFYVHSRTPRQRCHRRATAWAPRFAPSAPKEGFDAIPMWVADMNFPVVPTIQQEVIARVQHPAFGYFDPSDEYYNAIIQWQARRNGVTGLEKQHIGYENGVLGGVVSALNCDLLPGRQGSGAQPHLHRLYPLPGKQRLRHRPTPRCSRTTERHMADGLCRHGKAPGRGNTSMPRFCCSPHNPCGRVWERWELEKAMELFQQVQRLCRLGRDLVRH